jgi:hypothetical protein
MSFYSVMLTTDPEVSLFDMWVRLKVAQHIFDNYEFGHTAMQARVTRAFEKKSPSFSKSSPNSLQAQKKIKISTTKLNLEVQNIYIKPLLKP